MSTAPPGQDPLDMLKGFWGSMGIPLPGMVTPTVDTDEIGKRIADLKAVEGWLKTNLSMLQMTIQGLEMQRATLTTLASMMQAASGAESDGDTSPGGNANPFANPPMWPWNFMPAAESPPAAAKAPEGEAADPPRARSTAKRKPKR